ncbi:restriction endonuclease subunit S [Christiangramia portivictoriae]|uniref:restriction endonuclease subunit S n=1 Tax=Christiangramia portivictoriae TaxID=326069 RepID=UPI00146B01AE|nr:restriction endonuclease subunit S [Christiangramia portivictoriae]
MENPEGKFPAEFDTYQEVKNGDFVFCLFDVEETPRTVGLSPFDGMITGAYTVMQPRNTFNKSFLYYFYLNLDSKKRMRPLYKGLRNTIPKDSFFSFKTFVPPIKEQTAISSFLDGKCGKIDAAIEQKQKLIELLKERKQIIIQNAVTKGLDPDVKMKDSGVEWIGEIPEHWKVKKIKHLVKNSFSGGTPSTDRLDFWNGGIPWISSVDVKLEYLENTAREISFKGLSNSSAKLAPEGAVVFVTRSGILQHTFPISILRREMAINQDIKCLILKEIILSEYFKQLVKGNNSKILAEVRQQAATVESIDMEAFFNLRIAVPPIIEQEEVLELIYGTSEKVEKAIELQQKQIEKLREYKSSLIDAAVTGKIKVS